ncbi:nuclear transport factor 2 family protein [Amycolatopsis sp. K13G38]|uniref:Nuclear transport factor 2 family protein n=1 Tax=Amycolatopsis acididurans TaxID=2724524 RepID=A0ABX1IWZ8_9PSEU|nr:nuclear transport factor 2 family protein [Amycolatopsis acididurans]NKQ52020.1 nuclear transport factor 2 family protein [Amycolatopsis acididurans]
MNPGVVADVSAETLLRVHQLYAAQSHFIDGGRARDWAATFTSDGEFHSPSYPAPVAGTDELIAFAERFAAGDGVTRHVITNLYIEQATEHEATVVAYLQIVHTAPDGPSRLVRQTTITDRLSFDGTWRIRRREVRRDDQNR